MNILPQPYEAWFMTFFFVYVRVSAAVFTLPILSNESVIGPIRAGLAFWISIVLLGPLWGLNEAQIGWAMPVATRVFDGVLAFALAVAAEALLGIALGFIGQMILETIALAGEIIGQQSGFSAASVLDPITGQDIFLIAQINILFGTMIFIAIGGIEISLSVLADSFQVIQPGAGFTLVDFSRAGYETLIYNDSRNQALANIMYKIGLQIAAPMVTTMILISLAEAFIARTVPQLNILVVGFAVRILISLLILTWTMRPLYEVYSQYLLSYPRHAGAFLIRLASP